MVEYLILTERDCFYGDGGLESYILVTAGRFFRLYGQGTGSMVEAYLLGLLGYQLQKWVSGLRFYWLGSLSQSLGLAVINPPVRYLCFPHSFLITFQLALSHWQLKALRSLEATVTGLDSSRTHFELDINIQTSTKRSTRCC